MIGSSPEPTIKRESSSFRDPSGFIFLKDSQVYRKILPFYREEFELFKSSGLERVLEDKELIIPTSVEQPFTSDLSSSAILRPERIPFLSYPFEWSFSQLKDAALLTLEIQGEAFERGLVLKDASAYNVQFRNGKPIFIDTLSFARYREGSPWIAYRQFCRHFLAPLTLMSLVDVRLGTLSAQWIDGLPLDLASRLAPTSSKIKPGLLTHLHLHSKAEHQQAGSTRPIANVSRIGLAALVDSLKSTIASLHWNPGGTEWSDYYTNNNYESEAMAAKYLLVEEAIDRTGLTSGTCWDLGANNGEFSRIASRKGFETVAWDIDASAVEKNYLRIKKGAEKGLLPLVQDFKNPSPDLGWMSEERKGLVSRGPAKLALALALVHHLAIGNNVPLSMVVDFLAACGEFVVVEFVPKEDSQVARMLSNRADIFASYDLPSWRDALAAQFDILAEVDIPASTRTLYTLKKKA